MAGAGYAAYIWSAYGLTALAVVGLVARAIIDHRAQVRALARLGPAAGHQDGTQDG